MKPESPPAAQATPAGHQACHSSSPHCHWTLPLPFPQPPPPLTPAAQCCDPPAGHGRTDPPAQHCVSRTRRPRGACLGAFVSPTLRPWGPLGCEAAPLPLAFSVCVDARSPAHSGVISTVHSRTSDPRLGQRCNDHTATAVQPRGGPNEGKRARGKLLLRIFGRGPASLVSRLAAL